MIVGGDMVCVAVRTVSIPKYIPKEMHADFGKMIRKIKALYGVTSDYELSLLFSKYRNLVNNFMMRKTKENKIRFPVYYNCIEMLRRILADKEAGWVMPLCTERQLDIAIKKYNVLLNGGMNKPTIRANTGLQSFVLQRILNRDNTIQYGVLQDAIRRMDRVLQFFGYVECAAVGKEMLYVPDSVLPAVNNNFVEYRYTKMERPKKYMDEANTNRIIEETVDDAAFDDYLL
jgi:hypothetical protein